MSDAAPLHSTLDSPVPDDGAAEWFVGAAGVKLRAALFRPQGSPRGSVVINTGRTESIEKYYETVGELLGRGFVVLVHDWRGQGLSTRLVRDASKGHAAGFDDFVHDFRALLAVFETRLPKPWIVLGHSTGGCLTLLALTRGESRFAACVLTSPMLGLQIGDRSPWMVRLAAWFMATFGHAEDPVTEEVADPLWTRFENNQLTHDEERFRRYGRMLAAHPALALGSPTWGWLNSALSGMAEVRPAQGLTIPIVILSATDDTIVDSAAQRAAANRLGARLVEVPGAWHEILMETDPRRAIFWREFDATLARL